MREEFLHFVWKNKKFKTKDLYTVSGDIISIVSLGQINYLAGPDFFNAKIEIAGQLWAGNVEIHLKSSDWYAHNHENDTNYNNVILHVVWEDDANVFRPDNTTIPCLELKDIVPLDLLDNHASLMKSKKFINCEKDFTSIDNFTREHWLERLFVERLEQKSKLIFELLKASKNDWEKVLFCVLMKNFGLNINGPLFFDVAKTIDFTVFRKVKYDVIKSESLLFGMSNLLNGEAEDSYHKNLQEEFAFLSKKFRLQNNSLQKPNFYGLRPNNFPTIRLSQLANVYKKSENLFLKVIETNELNEIKSIFEAAASYYWDTHFVFGKNSRKSRKKLTSTFIELLIVNTILPIKFSYAKNIGESVPEHIINIARSLKPETNSIISKLENIGSKSMSAFDTQSKIQLFNSYCKENKCLKCSIGNKLLLDNS
ncbi:DUF2851 family protein [Croceivirga thetidis]|uniref:DUF2851 family protein n=1 Tax=Croceivirga thetidis TaxID=2721623 RepID=A0ABX1GTX9_9FLAO|nr:DUF2851 family protein [Croceivirga thetidis]NKI33410.1 DUF2851 family protein [Croceivirga thetidis]